MPVVLALWSVLHMSAGGAAAGGTVSAAIEPDLAAQLTTMSPADTVAVFVRLPTHADLRGVTGPDHRQRAGQVVTALRTHAQRQQAALVAMLSGRAAVTDVQSWWIDNAVSFTGSAAAIRAVAARVDVQSIGLDDAKISPSSLPGGARPTEAVAAGLTMFAGAPTGPAAPNLVQIGAPTLWARGITGAQTVVADLDTGVDGSQPDLAGNWRSTDGWFDPYGQHSTPTDINGHGTWTTSVMVGRDGGGQAVGVVLTAHQAEDDRAIVG